MLARVVNGLCTAWCLLVMGSLPGCAGFAKCGFHGCPGDAEITAKVQALFDRQPALQAPNQVEVQTVDHVVYLSGLVDTPFERRLAEELAQEASGSRVVNTIGVSNER